MEAIKNKISLNFTTLKSISILVIVTGHFYRDIQVLWVPAALGLFIFAYSSAFFTALKYSDSYALKGYFAKKIYRLGVNLLVINAFLAALFLVQGKDNIWNVKTLLSFFGLTGILDWLRISIDGPFGAGMWFLTLIIIFYALYPFLNVVLQGKRQIYLFSLIAIILLSWLNENVVYGHALWLTIGGFILGFISAKIRLRVKKSLSVIVMSATTGSILILNYLMSIKAFNFYLLLLLFGFFVLSVEHLYFPKTVHSLMDFLSGFTLEIYLIHTAIFIGLTAVRPVDFILSVLLIVAVSILLVRISNSVKKQLMGDSFRAENKKILLSVKNPE